MEDHLKSKKHGTFCLILEILFMNSILKYFLKVKDGMEQVNPERKMAFFETEKYPLKEDQPLGSRYSSTYRAAVFSL